MSLAAQVAEDFRKAKARRAPRHVFRGANLVAQTATDRELVIGGPAGTGKSVALLHRIHTIAETYPRSRCLILRKTRSSLTESGLVTFEEKVLPPDHPALFGARGQRIKRENRSAYTYPNGATIVVGGMDEPTRIFSAEYDAIYWQEVTEGQREEWESLLRALRNGQTPSHHLLGDCNPQAPTHWVRARDKSGSLRLLEGRHTDNPYLWDEEKQEWTPRGRDYLADLSRMTGVLGDRLFKGLWVAAEGAIFTMFRRQGPGAHVIPRFEVPPGWRVILSIDFGFTHPFAAQVWVVDWDGRMFLEREIHMSGRTLDALAPEIKAMLRGRSYSGVADSSAPESIARLRDLGIHCEPTPKGTDSVRASIRQCVARMADPGDGHPRIAIMEGALVERDEKRAAKHLPLCLLDEIELYRWKVDRNGVALEEPVKELDDGVDGMRYAVQLVDGSGSGRLDEGDVRMGRSDMGGIPSFGWSGGDEE